MTPGLLNLPEGCAFRTRCTRADAACVVEPEAREVVAGRSIRCFHPELDLTA
jgi:peptide/nickel transport system ATP-binding protein